MNTTYCIAITLGEFQAWFNAGELRCAADRMVAILAGAEGAPCLDSIANQELLSRLPFVDLEEEHNVLVAVIDMAGLAAADVFEISESAGGGLRAAYLPISCLTKIHPLTERGARLLASRLDGFAIRLGKPICEEGANSLWKFWLWRRALRGGGELLRALIADASYAPSPEITAEVRHAVEAHGNQEDAKPVGLGLISAVLGYDRHKPITSSDIGYMVDLGVILKERFGDDSAYSAFIKGLRLFITNKGDCGDKLPDLINDRAFASLLAAHDAPRTDLFIPLILYLRWRYLAQKARAITIEALSRDIREYSGKFPKPAIEQAVWLLGAYAGFDRLAKEIYLYQANRYRFVQDPVAHEPVILKEYVPPILPSQPEGGGGDAVVDGAHTSSSSLPGNNSTQTSQPEPEVASATKPRKKRAKSAAKGKSTSRKKAGEGASQSELKLNN